MGASNLPRSASVPKGAKGASSLNGPRSTPNGLHSTALRISTHAPDPVPTRRFLPIVSTAEKEGRKALNRLRRAVEKSKREVEALRGALCHAEGEDFPATDYEDVVKNLMEIEDFLDREAARLQEKILHAGGLEPGRVRRGSPA